MADSSFPLVAVLEALLAWQRGPSAARQARVGEALGAVASTVGARGVRLRVDTVSATTLEAGFGTLAPGRVTSADADGMVAFDLRADEGRAHTGSLWLDSPEGDAATAVRAIELAVEAAWSREEVRQTAERLEALDAATRGIAGVLALDRVLQLIVDRVRELIAAEYAALGIVDENGVIEQFVTSGISRQQHDRIGALPRGRGLLGLIIRENRTYRVGDISHHPASYGFPPHHPLMTSFLGVPIQVKGRSVGNFYLTNKRDEAEFSEADERLVEMFALHAGVAIENARLHEQVQRMAVIDERTRIGKDLHDGIIQAIYAVGLSLEDVPELMQEAPAEAVARVDRAIDSLNLAIRDIRNFIFGLRPELAAAGGLVAGLAALANEFRLNTVIDVEFEAGEGVPDIPADRRGEVLQIAREALSNVARHSKATSARITVAGVGDRLELLVADNGLGFDPDLRRDGVHQGLVNMRARALDLGGALRVESQPGGGTRIIVRLPVDPAPRTATRERRET